MTIYDVTITFHEGMPTWDGEPPPVCVPIKEIGVDGESARVSILTMGLHSGTHVDAPCHFIPGAAGLTRCHLMRWSGCVVSLM